MSVADPVIVLCNARSGSTLLRYLLDTHPDVAVPPETLLGSLCTSVLQFLGELPDGGDDLPAYRELVRAPLDRHAASRGKRLWCHKSIHTVEHLDAVNEIFPTARYLGIHRHAMDMIASGLEASRWGFGRYGFRSYVRQRPDNTVAALAQYWIERTEKILAFERAVPGRVRRLRYEDLVADPPGALTGVLEFLGVDRAPELVARIVAEALRTPHDPGAGDYKIDFSSAVTTDSVGSGRAVPVVLLERRQRVAMNELLRRLDYEPVGADWNTATAAPRQPGADLRDAVAQVMAGLPTLPRTITLDVAYPDGALLRWSLAPGTAPAPAESPGPTDGKPTYQLRAETLLQLASGTLGFAAAVRAGLVERARPDEDQDADRLFSSVL